MAAVQKADGAGSSPENGQEDPPVKQLDLAKLESRKEDEGVSFEVRVILLCTTADIGLRGFDNRIHQMLPRQALLARLPPSTVFVACGGASEWSLHRA